MIGKISTTKYNVVIGNLGEDALGVYETGCFSTSSSYSAFCFRRKDKPINQYFGYILIAGLQNGLGCKFDRFLYISKATFKPQFLFEYMLVKVDAHAMH